jgi:hypothetical protein
MGKIKAFVIGVVLTIVGILLVMLAPFLLCFETVRCIYDIEKEKKPNK